MSRQILAKSPNLSEQSKTARSKPLKNDMPVVEKPQLSNMWVLPLASGQTDFDNERNLPTSQQKPVMRQIQRVHGNQAAQRMIQPAVGGFNNAGFLPVESGAVQRQNPPGGEKSSVKKFTMKTPVLEIPINKSLGYVELDSISAWSEGGVEVVPPPEKQTTGPGGSTVKQGVVVGEGVGFQTEVVKEWEDSAIKRYSGFTPSMKGAGEVTTNGGELALEGALEGKTEAYSLKFSILSFDPKSKESKFEFASLSFGRTKYNLKNEFKLPNGYTIKYEYADKYEVKFKPDYIKLARFIGTRLAAAIASDVAVVSGAVFMIAFIIAGTVTTFMEASELRVIPDEVSKQISNFAHGYEDAMKGDPSSGKGPGYAEGYSSGEGQAKKAMEKVPGDNEAVKKEVVGEEARKKDLWQEGVDQYQPAAKEAALKKWQDEHWFDTHIGMGYSYRQLSRVLDALVISR